MSLHDRYRELLGVKEDKSLEEILQESDTWLAEFNLQESQPKLDPEKELEQLLASLPRCSRYILISGPKDGPDFRCEIIADLHKFQPWLLNHIKEFSMNDVGSLAFPHWLENADLSDDRVTPLDPKLRRVIGEYFHDLVVHEVADVSCPACNKKYSPIDRQELNIVKEPPFYASTTEWRCPVGHLLYSSDDLIRT